FPVVRGILRDAFWFARSADCDGEKIAVRAERFILVGISREANLAAVGRECNRFRRADVEGRHIGIGARSEIARRAAIDGNNEQVAAFSVGPAVPMAEKKL